MKSPPSSPATLPQALEIRVPCRFEDGHLIISRAAADAFRFELSQVRVPIVGYVALQAALAKVGIKAGVRTLKDWRARRKLPHRKHNRDVVFYLDEVLDRIGGNY